MNFQTKRDAGNPIFKTLSKTASVFSQLASDQQVSAYNWSFILEVQSHGCKEVLVILLHAWDIADAVFLYVFNIGFPASLLDIIVI